MRKENGVTITALIIAVILLIILAAVSITATRNSNRDILETAYDAKTGMEVATYQEELDIIDIRCYDDQLSNNGDSEYYIDLFKESVEKDSIFDGSTVEKKSSSILRIETKEGYVFIVTADGAEYAGISGEFDETYAITGDDVTFTYSPTNWTNENVEVTISLNFDIGDNTFQYSLDGEEWYDYEEAFEVETNTKIYVMYSTYGDDYVTGEVTNIDKLAPESFVTKVTNVEIDAITVSGSTVDSEATDEYGESGIDHYEYSIVETDSGNTVLTWYESDDTTYTFDDLEQGTNYTVYIKAVDKAGNETISYIDVTTERIDLTDDIVEFTQSEDDWTNEDIIVYVDITDEDIQDKIDDGTYTLEYSTDGGETWEEYDPDTGIPVDENTEIEVRLSDGKNTGEEVTHEVDNIDKTAPEVELEVTDTSTNSITIEVSATDEGDDGTSDNSSGIASYEFQISTDGENWETIETVETSDGTYEYTYEGLTDDTTYYVRVVVTDEAGNETTSDTEEVTLGEVPGGNDDSGTYDEDGVSIPTVTFSYSETDWTNEDVTVTITVNGDTADLVEDGTYTIEYNTEDPTDESCWKTYTEEVVFETNGSIYARLSDGTNTGDYATGIVSNIDKLNPTVDSIEVTTNSVTFTASDSSNSSYGASGIVGYLVTTSSTTPTSSSSFTDCRDENGDGVTSLEVTVDGLTQNTTYYIYVIDDAGNISSLSDNSYMTTESVPDLTDDIVEFTQSEDDWTNEDVIVYVDITDEDIQDKIDDGTYTLEYSTDGGETWEEYDPDTGIPVDENTEIEVRLSDGENTGGEVMHEVDNIDKTAPDVELEVTDTSTNSITIEVTAEDLGDNGTSDNSSGIAKYEFQISTDGENWETVETYSGSESPYTYTYSELEDGETYYVRVIVTDEAGNETISNVEEVTLGEVPEVIIRDYIGDDYVDYTAEYEIIEDGDTANDWRLFYIIEEDDEDRNISAASVSYDEDGNITEFTTTEDGQVYLIAADYVLSDNMPTSPSGVGSGYSEEYPWSLYFTNIYSEYTGVTGWDSHSSIWNSYYLAENSSSTSVANRMAEYLLDASAWGEYYLNSDYASYVIGSPTIELWVDAWNSKGYTMLYYNNVDDYGYYIGTDEDSESRSQNLTSSYISNSGYDDTIFFPHQSDTDLTIGNISGSASGYWIASPIAVNGLALVGISSSGTISSYSYNTQYLSARPIICLSSGVIGTYNEETGVWTLERTDGQKSNNYAITKASITISYSTTEWTNEDVTVTIEVNGDTADLIENGTYILEYTTGDPTDESSWTEYSGEKIIFSENGNIYVRLSDGVNEGDYATGIISNIDKLSPSIGSIEATTISVTITGTDDASGIVGYYISTNSDTPTEDDFTDCMEDGAGVTSLEKTIDGLELETQYYVWIIDDAGNISNVSEITTYGMEDLYSGEELGLEVAIGDYVDYPIDINENGDTTDDWRIWYINDDGVIFLITAEYVPNDSEYLDTTDEDGDGVYDATGLTPNDIYMIYWSSVPQKQEINSLTNILFMENYSYLEDSTNNNVAKASTLLNVNNWTGFIIEEYADYAIGGTSLEMWIKSWNENTSGYLTLSLGTENSYGYLVNVNSSTDVYEIYFDLQEEELMTLYFPYDDYADNYAYTYWTTTPSGGEASSLTSFFAFSSTYGLWDCRLWVEQSEH